MTFRIIPGFGRQGGQSTYSAGKKVRLQPEKTPRKHFSPMEPEGNFPLSHRREREKDSRKVS